MRSAPFFEPDPSGGVLGPSLAGKRPKTDQNFNLDFSFLLRPLVSVEDASCLGVHRASDRVAGLVCDPRAWDGVDFSYVCLCSRGPGPADLSFLLFWAVLWPRSAPGPR